MSLLVRLFRLTAIGAALLMAAVMLAVERSSLRSSQPLVQRASTLIGSNDRSMRNVSERTPQQVLLSSSKRARVAVLIPFLGSRLPIWFHVFAASCAAHKDLLDFIIFIPEEAADVYRSIVPENVKFVSTTTRQLADRLESLLSSNNAHRGGKRNNVISSELTTLFARYPYLFVELKPLLGLLFEDQLSPYTHWGYGDLDIFIGDLSHALKPLVDDDEMDVISFTFGDHYSLYLRAQLAVMRKSDVSLNLWKRCIHITHFLDRTKAFLLSHEGRNFTTESKIPFGWRFQSAEGCISAALLAETALQGIFIPLQLSDAFVGKDRDRETIVSQGQFFRCFGSPFLSERVVRMNGHDWRAHICEENERAWLPVQRANVRCSYWIDPRFEWCTEGLPANHVVLLKRNQSQRVWSSIAFEKSNACLTAAFIHFQSWKRGWYFSTLPAISQSISSLNGLISQLGLIPYADTSPNDVICAEFGSDLKSCSCIFSAQRDVQVLRKGSSPFDLTIIFVEKQSFWLNSLSMLSLRKINKILVLHKDDAAQRTTSFSLRGFDDFTTILLVDLAKTCKTGLNLSDKVLFNVGLAWSSPAGRVLLLPREYSLSQHGVDNLLSVLQNTPGEVAFLLCADQERKEVNALLNYCTRNDLSKNASENSPSTDYFRPVVFARNYTPHGSSFIKFATELGGNGCEEWVFFTALVAAGYSLQVKNMSHGEILIDRDPQRLVRCPSENELFETRRDFLSSISTYYRRTKTLREMGGHLNVFSTSAMGRLVELSPIKHKTRLP